MVAKMNETNLLPGSLSVIPCGCACEALDFLQQIYNSSPIMMLAVSKSLHIVRLNQRFCNFIGRTEETMLDASLLEILPSAAEKLGEMVNEVIVSQQSITSQEIEFSFNHVSCFWQISCYPVSGPTEKVEAVNLIVHDITDLRKTQQELERAYENILELQEKLEQENRMLRHEISRSAAEQTIIGSSRGIRNVLDQIVQVAPTGATVLITGETGTGKELAAKAIHQQSSRAGQPLVIVNCAAMPANLIESELFGHEKGSFTGAIARKNGKFEMADGGTIFLDEIGELPLELQSKLLRVLQENQIERIGSTRPLNIDVRVIAATNRELHQEVAAGKFRQDLFYRLNVFPVRLPPLRERGVDIIEIADSYIATFSERMGRQRPKLTQESIVALLNYEWPGNIRELRNVIERAMIMCKSDTIIVTIPEKSITKPPFQEKNPLENLDKLRDVEKKHILQVLQRCNWKIRGHNGAAEILDLKPTTLESKLLKHGIKRPKPPQKED